MLFDRPHLIQIGLHEGVQWTLRRFKRLFSPRTLRADSMTTLYNNRLENFRIDDFSTSSRSRVYSEVSNLPERQGLP
jgi:hypothetical protein